MSVRDKAIEFLTRRVVPGVHFTYGEPSDPRWTEEWSKAEALYLALVGTIDWQRVVLEAWSRHNALHPSDDAEKGIWYDSLCGECVREALLTQDSVTRWAGPAEPVRPPVTLAPGPIPQPALVDAIRVDIRRWRRECYGRGARGRKYDGTSVDDRLAERIAETMAGRREEGTGGTS